MKEYEGFPFPSLDEDDPEVDRLLLHLFSNTSYLGSTRSHEQQLLDTLRLFAGDFVIEYPEGV